MSGTSRVCPLLLLYPFWDRRLCGVFVILSISSGPIMVLQNFICPVWPEDSDRLLRLSSVLRFWMHSLTITCYSLLAAWPDLRNFFSVTFLRHFFLTGLKFCARWRQRRFALHQSNVFFFSKLRCTNWKKLRENMKQSGTRGWRITQWWHFYQGLHFMTRCPCFYVGRKAIAASISIASGDYSGYSLGYKV